MTKPFVALTYIFIGFIFGLLTTATIIEHDRKVARNIIDSAIILELPKDEADLAHQLLYLGASKGMLEEIQRQRMVKGEVTRPVLGNRRVQSRSPMGMGRRP